MKTYYIKPHLIDCGVGIEENAENIVNRQEEMPSPALLNDSENSREGHQQPYSFTPW